MDYRITTGQAALRETVLETTAERPFDAEVTLPDYCPDIGRMLRCRAVPSLTLSELRADGVRLEGSVRLCCLYTDSRDKALRCCEHDVPFGVSIAAPVATSAAASIATSAATSADSVALNVVLHQGYVNCRATGQRRLDVHGAVTAAIRADAPTERDIISGAEGDGVRVRCENVTISEFTAHKNTAFAISESLELPQGKPPIAALLRSGAVMVLQECKPIAGKLIVKGEAALDMVYRADSGEIETMQYALPFSQFIDISGVDDSSDIDIGLDVQSCELAPGTDANGEYRRVAADIRARARIAAFAEREISIMTDAYSVECELDIERRRLTLEHLAARAEGRCSVTCRPESSREIERVLDCWCETENASAACHGNRASVKGSAKCCAVVRLSDGEAEYLESPVSFESETLLPGECGEGRCDASAAARSCVCSIAAANRLELRADIDTVATIREDTVVDSICAIKPDESRPKHSDERPAAVLYFGETGEQLWSIARQFDARAEDIAAENGIEVDALEDERLLLITVK